MARVHGPEHVTDHVADETDNAVGPGRHGSANNQHDGVLDAVPELARGHAEAARAACAMRA